MDRRILEGETLMKQEIEIIHRKPGPWVTFYKGSHDGDKVCAIIAGLLIIASLLWIQLAKARIHPKPAIEFRQDF